MAMRCKRHLTIRGIALVSTLVAMALTTLYIVMAAKFLLLLDRATDDIAFIQRASIHAAATVNNRHVVAEGGRAFALEPMQHTVTQCGGRPCLRYTNEHGTELLWYFVE